MTDPKKPLPVFSVKAADAGFTIFRDAEALETPRNLPVIVPTRALADAIVQECGAQDEKLNLRTMPMTQMALTALDITARQSKEIVAGIVRYGESELLCIRAGEPADLIAEQTKIWQPYLDWCRTAFGADFRIGSGIAPFAQNPAALAAMQKVVAEFDIFPLTGVSEAVGISGSLILGLALATGHASVEQVFAAAELDQLWQARRWGEDPVTVARHADIKRDLADCARWFALIG